MTGPRSIPRRTWLLALVAVVALVGPAAWSRDAAQPAGPALPDAPRLPASLDEPAPPPGADLTRLPTGRDFVSARILRGSGASPLLVRLEIADGWHVNANPASFDFLIPTRVRPLDRATGFEASYPPGEPHQLRFSLDPIAVYSGQVDIQVRTQDRVREGAAFELTFQACDDSSCLPPESVRLTVP